MTNKEIIGVFRNWLSDIETETKRGSTDIKTVDQFVGIAMAIAALEQVEIAKMEGGE